MLCSFVFVCVRGGDIRIIDTTTLGLYSALKEIPNPSGNEGT